MELKKKVRWYNIFSYDDLLVQELEKLDIDEDVKRFSIKYSPKILRFIISIGSFMILYYFFNKAYLLLGEKFFILVFTYIVILTRRHL